MAKRPNLSFEIALGALGLVFLGAAYLAFDAFQTHAKADNAFRRTNAAVAGLVGGTAVSGSPDAVALTDANVAAARTDLANLQTRREALRNAIAGAEATQIESRFVGISNELATQIQESVSRWRRLALSKDAKLPSRDEIYFGFRRYMRDKGTQPQRLYREVDRQRKIIEWILETLLEARSPGSPLLIQSIDREPIETFSSVSAPGESQGFTIDTPSSEAISLRLQSDEFVLSGHSFRRPGQVNSFAFRVRFVARTDTLRAFLNLVQNSGRPVAISGVEVTVPSEDTLKELLAPPANLSATSPLPPVTPTLTLTLGGENAPLLPVTPAPKLEKQVVVPSKASEFAVRLEYLLPLIEAPATPPAK